MTGNDKNANKRLIKILIGITSIGLFVSVSLLYFFIFSDKIKDYNINAILSLAAGSFVSLMVIVISGIFAEFTFKSGFVEISAQLEKKINDVQSNVTDTKQEVKGKIAELNQHISNMQSLVVATRFNANVNPTFNIAVDNLKNAYSSIEEKQSKLLSEQGIGNKVEPEKKLLISKSDRVNIDSLRETKEKIEKAYTEITQQPIPKDIDQTLKEANYLYYKGQYQEANNLYNQILKDDPTNFYALLNNGLTLMRLDKNEEAVQVLENAHDVNSGDPLALINLGVAYLRLKNVDKALLYLEKAEKIDPSRPMLHYNMACAYSILGRKTQAIKHLKESIEKDPRNIERAKSDTDFGNIKNDDLFKEIVSSP